MRFPAALFCSFCLPGVGADALRAAQPDPIPWHQVILTREDLPAEANVLTRWRPFFPRLFPQETVVAEQLHAATSPLNTVPPDAIELRRWLDALRPDLVVFKFNDNDRLQFPALRGPETPFPDHQPLRQLAFVRAVSLKTAWQAGARDDAVGLALENLTLARTVLAAQEGLVPLLNASGIWQQALDDVYWLAKQPDLRADQAARLQLALFRDDHLAANALIRAFRGEFTFFTLATVDRLPRTQDIELFLSSIGSLGLAPASSPEAGMPRLTIPERTPFDRDATLQAAADDVQGWVRALTVASRHPRGFYAHHTAARLQAYVREIPRLVRYAVQQAPPTDEQARLVDVEISTVENPAGKLFLVITTSKWEPISTSIFRREAQRSALTGLLAWRRLGRPAPWKDLITAGLLPAAPPDPFSSTHLHADPARAHIWSVAENGTDEGGTGDGENLGRPDDLSWPAFMPK